MKKLLAIMIILVIALTFSGCDSDNPIEQARAFVFGGGDDDVTYNSSRYYDYTSSNYYNDYTSSNYYDYYDNYSSNSYYDYYNDYNNYSSNSYYDDYTSNYYDSYTSTDSWDDEFEEYEILVGRYYEYSRSGLNVSGIEAQIAALDNELDIIYEGLSESDKTKFTQDASAFISKMESTYGYTF